MALNPIEGQELLIAVKAVNAHRAAAKEFVRAVNGLDPTLCQLPRARGKWSPQQEIAHLVLTCREFTAAVRREREFELMVSTERAAHIHATMLPRILRGGSFPSGAKAPPRVHPPRSLETVPVLLAQLQEARRQLEFEVVSACRNDPERQVKHPYFGFLRLPELLVLLAAHLRHHSGNIAPLVEYRAV